MQVACPHCRKSVSVNRVKPGDTAACPHCRKTFRVPKDPAGSDAPASAPTATPAPSQQQPTPVAALPVGQSPQQARPVSVSAAATPVEPAVSVNPQFRERVDRHKRGVPTR